MIGCSWLNGRQFLPQRPIMIVSASEAAKAELEADIQRSWILNMRRSKDVDVGHGGCTSGGILLVLARSELSTYSLSSGSLCCMAWRSRGATIVEPGVAEPQRIFRVVLGSVNLILKNALKSFVPTSAGSTS